MDANSKVYTYGFAAYGRIDRPCDDPQYMVIFNATPGFKASMELAAAWVKGHNDARAALAE